MTGVDYVLDLMRICRDATACPDCGQARVVGQEYFPSSNLPVRALCGPCKSESRKGDRVG